MGRFHWNIARLPRRKFGPRIYRDPFGPTLYCLFWGFRGFVFFFAPKPRKSDPVEIVATHMSTLIEAVAVTLFLGMLLVWSALGSGA